MSIDSTIGKVIELPRTFYRRGDASMYSLLQESGYFAVHAEVTESAIQKALREHPECVADWMDLSEGKRASSGWFLRRGENGYEVGYFPVSGDDDRVVEYRDAVAACAAFVKREIEDIRTDGKA